MCLLLDNHQTPTKTFGIGAGSAANLRYLELAARTIAKASKSDKIIVEKSTVPVRTAATLRRIFAENNKEHTLEVVNNPEFWPRAPPSTTFFLLVEF